MSVTMTERQQKLLLREDPRFFAVGPAGDGLGMIMTSEKPARNSKRVVHFGLPSAPSMFLDLAFRAHRRRSQIDVEACFKVHEPHRQLWPDDHIDLFDFFENFCAEVTMAFTSIEAFANENIPAKFEYRTLIRKEEVKIQGIDIERQISLDEKLKKVLPQAHSIKGPSGSAVWEKFRTLKHIRDRLIHLKSSDRTSSGPENQTIWGFMIQNRKDNYAEAALNVIGGFPSLTVGRRWFDRMRDQWCSLQP